MNALYAVSLVTLYLACYSFLGWVVEVLFVLVTDQRLENRGFLTGPFLPIYGIGAIVLVLLVEPYVKNPFLVFVACVLISSIVEYTGSFLLDKLFHVSLWDYHDQRFNVNGRICLRNSLCFGALGLLLIYVLQPVLSSWLKAIPQDAAIAVAGALLGILLIDSVNSIASLAKVRPVLDQMQGSLKEAHDHIERRTIDAENSVAAKKAARSSSNQATLSRLTRVFPHARSVLSARQTNAAPPKA